MRANLCKASIVLMVLLAAGERGVLSESGERDGLSVFHGIEGLYMKWNEGLFGSRGYYEKALTRYLGSIVGREIATDYDYLFIAPEGDFGEHVSCRLLFGRWLHIYGDVDRESLKGASAGAGPVRKWWRSGVLVSAKGKIRKFRLERDRFGDRVDLYLHSVRLDPWIKKSD